MIQNKACSLLFTSAITATTSFKDSVNGNNFTYSLRLNEIPHAIPRFSFSYSSEASTNAADPRNSIVHHRLADIILSSHYEHFSPIKTRNCIKTYLIARRRVQSAHSYCPVPAQGSVSIIHHKFYRNILVRCHGAFHIPTIASLNFKHTQPDSLQQRNHKHRTRTTLPIAPFSTKCFLHKACLEEGGAVGGAKKDALGAGDDAAIHGEGVCGVRIL